MSEVKPFTRRTHLRRPGQCGCPLLVDPCPYDADGEDRLCTRCRVQHHPDREASEEEEEEEEE